jgi:hypothetical protein
VEFQPGLNLKFIIQAYRALTAEGQLHLSGDYSSASAVLKAAGFH